MNIAAAIAAHERYFAWLARQYYAPGLEEQDLIQEARIGAYRACRAYDPCRGSLEAFVRLSARAAVIDAKAARRGKHDPLNNALSFAMPVGGDHDHDGLTLADVLPAPARPPAALSRATVETFQDELARVLSPLEDAALSAIVTGDGYASLTADGAHTYKSIDNAIQRARAKAAALAAELGLGVAA